MNIRHLRWGEFPPRVNAGATRHGPVNQPAGATLQSSEEDFSEFDVDYSDQDSSAEDFDTESDEENASEHEEAEIEWTRPARWDAQASVTKS